MIPSRKMGVVTLAIVIAMLQAVPSMASAANAAIAATTAQGSPPVNLQIKKLTMLDMVVFGKALLAVGERGVIARSEDGGQTWQGRLSPTTRTLTALAFAGERIGVAVGHGGTVLRTSDGGVNWQSVDIPEIGKDAVLGITALRSGRFVAVGAFGMYLVSEDEGKSWVRKTVISDDFDRHISKVLEARDASSLYLVGETGVMARSTDGGSEWKPLVSPYAGSYFGILEMKDGALLAYGMRGNVFRSADQGVTWTQVPLDTKATINGGSVAPDGQVVLVGNRGLLAISQDQGRSFLLRNAPEGTPIAQGRLLADGALVYTGTMATGRIASTLKPLGAPVPSGDAPNKTQ